MKEMGLSGPKWTMGLSRRFHPGVMPRWWPSSQVATTTAEGRLGDRHMPGGRRPLGPASVGVAEDRVQHVWRINKLVDFGVIDTSSEKLIVHSHFLFIE